MKADGAKKLQTQIANTFSETFFLFSLKRISSVLRKNKKKQRKMGTNIKAKFNAVVAQLVKGK